MGSWRFPEPVIRHSRIEFPGRGLIYLDGLMRKTMKVGTCAARVFEPREVRKEAAVRRLPEGAAVIWAGVGDIGAEGWVKIDTGVRGHF